MRILLDKTGMSAEDWQKYRKSQKGIGGSDCSIVLGLSKYKSPFTLWLEKTGQMEPPELSNEYMEWGNILEPVIREKFRQVTGFEVIENPYVMAHDKHDFMVANIDGEVVDPAFGGERGILEIKTASERYKKDWENGIPLQYMCQVQHYLAVMGENYKYAYVACLIGGSHFKYYLVERDDYIIDKIIAAESAFTNMVENNIPPEIGGSEYEVNWLNSTYPEANEEEKIMSNNHEELASEYLRLNSMIKELTQEADAIKNILKLEAKEFKYLKGNTIKISLPTINKTIFDSKKFAEDHPDLYEQYKNKQSTYRGFTISFL